ncbi:MAG: DUF4369 domain-containing protein [Bacteroidaceae bacterium]|nr:DUF4369 domain-containing protein [Bacteroidaceae bacterium]
MKKLLYSLLIGLTLLSCGGSQGQFQLQGNFAHLEQGEFLIYSLDGGLNKVDSLHVRDGKFEYVTKLDGKATYHILYPNYSELVIFGHSGGVVKIKGDAQNLNGVEVKGDKDNETYTQFRKEISEKSEKEVQDIARNYILSNPTLDMSQYLLGRYFILSDLATQEETKEIYDSLLRALPEDVSLSLLADDVKSKGMTLEGRKMPDFKLETREMMKDSTGHKIVSLADYKGKYLLMVFWANWKSGSQSALFHARHLRRDSHGKVEPLSYSLEVDNRQLTEIEKRDSVNYASFCDFRCWSSPLVRQLGIRDLPYYILVGPDQKIIASGTDWLKEIEPKTKDLCS